MFINYMCNVRKVPQALPLCVCYPVAHKHDMHVVMGRHVMLVGNVGGGWGVLLGSGCIGGGQGMLVGAGKGGQENGMGCRGQEVRERARDVKVGAGARSWEPEGMG